MNILRLETTDSTNTWVARNEDRLETPSLVYCITQSAGRGQRGNYWESEPGKNITASLLFHPQDFPANDQFRISEAVAIAIVDYFSEKGVMAKVKWPNDIYVGDQKICGILVEHVVTGKNISRTIAGFGINLNQEEFHSDAPNPVSLVQITGEKYELEKEIEKVAVQLGNRLSRLDDPTLHHDFMKLLWRNDGELHPFYDRKNDERISAKILSVAPEGIISLVTDKGETRNYAFKEIEFILE